MRYPQKRGVSRKRGWEFWKLFNLGKGKSLTLRKEVFAWVTRGRGELYRLTIECTSSKTFVKDFLYTLKVTSTAASSLLHNTKNAYFSRINFSLYHSSVSWDITPLYFFIWKFICFGQNKPIKVQIFRLATACMKINQILHVICQATTQFFFKFCITLQCHDIIPMKCSSWKIICFG